MINMRSVYWIYQAGISALAITLILGIAAIASLYRLNEFPKYKAAPLTSSWSKFDATAFDFDADVFKKAIAESEKAPQEGAAKRYRLAGTFFAIGANQQSRKAILDDLQRKQQLLVTEGDLIENEAQVLSIMADRVILKRGASEEQILLCFNSSGLSATQQVIGASTAKNQLQADIQSRFGKRIGDKHWLLTRSELMNYYKEVLNNTERLTKIYESLKPVYEGQNIAGYTLDIEGEGDMFSAFGLRQGDTIRQVNSMPMTSQVRAEYFINEFVKNRVNGFVLDIERAGRKEKLIYMVR